MLLHIKTNSAVNIRSGPGMGFETVGAFPSGHILTAKDMQKMVGVIYGIKLKKVGYQVTMLFMYMK